MLSLEDVIQGGRVDPVVYLLRTAWLSKHDRRTVDRYLHMHGARRGGFYEDRESRRRFRKIKRRFIREVESRDPWWKYEDPSDLTVQAAKVRAIFHLLVRAAKKHERAILHTRV